MWGGSRGPHVLCSSLPGAGSVSRLCPARACQIPDRRPGHLIPALWNHCRVTSGRRHSHHMLCLWEAAVKKHLAVGKPHVTDGVLGCSFQSWLSFRSSQSCHPSLQPSKAKQGVLFASAGSLSSSTEHVAHLKTGRSPLLCSQGAWQHHHQEIGFCQVSHGSRKDLVPLRGF